MTGYRFVEHLPDLIGSGEYEAHPDGGLVRVRIRVTESGVEVLGDAIRPDILERLLEMLGPAEIQQMLCG